LIQNTGGMSGWGEFVEYRLFVTAIAMTVLAGFPGGLDVSIKNGNFTSWKLHADFSGAIVGHLSHPLRLGALLAGLFGEFRPDVHPVIGAQGFSCNRASRGFFNGCTVLDWHASGIPVGDSLLAYSQSKRNCKAVLLCIDSGFCFHAIDDTRFVC